MGIKRRLIDTLVAKNRKNFENVPFYAQRDLKALSSEMDLIERKSIRKFFIKG
jgi:hypothetical protein